MIYYDDNYGHWKDTDEDEVVEFYHDVQRRNVEKVCKRCERKVMILPQYSICGSCADKIELGVDF